MPCCAGVAAIAVNSTDTYWLTTNDELWSAPNTGGAPQLVHAFGSNMALGRSLGATDTRIAVGYASSNTSAFVSGVAWFSIPPTAPQLEQLAQDPDFSLPPASASGLGQYMYVWGLQDLMRGTAPGDFTPMTAGARVHQAIVQAGEDIQVLFRGTSGQICGSPIPSSPGFGTASVPKDDDVVTLGGGGSYCLADLAGGTSQGVAVRTTESPVRIDGIGSPLTLSGCNDPSNFVIEPSSLCQSGA